MPNEKVFVHSRYIFNTIAIVLVLGALYLFEVFQDTKNNIESVTYSSNNEYVKNLASNISIMLQSILKDNFYERLRLNPDIAYELEQRLQLLIGSKYRYVYVVDKPDHSLENFRFLLDGEKNIQEKSIFGELYTPSNLQNWNKVYETLQPLSFKHTDIESLWLTHLYPVVVNGNVEAVIVLDFSIEGHHHIVKSLDDLHKLFWLSIPFMILVFITVVIFSYLDDLREKQKDKLLQKLEKNQLP